MTSILIALLVLGIAAAGEPMFRSRPRDRYFNLQYSDPREPPPSWLVACAALRLEDPPWGITSTVIALWRAQGHGVREIARRLARAPSTISREVRRNAATRSGGFEYRATTEIGRAHV